MVLLYNQHTPPKASVPGASTSISQTNPRRGFKPHRQARGHTQRVCRCDEPGPARWGGITPTGPGELTRGRINVRPKQSYEMGLGDTPQES